MRGDRSRGKGEHGADKWRCLSLTQPWPWIILNLGKRVENRSRNIGNFRGPLLLHAAKGMPSREYWAAYDFVAARFGHMVARRIPPTRALPLGAIVGRCDVVNQCAPGGVWSAHEVDPKGIHCDGQHEPAEWPELSRWYMGDHAYVLENVAPTKIVPCAGALGFWRPPASVLAELGLIAPVRES